jgi:2-polyprenyl-6-methoxyphenol hydroxylase-like FAD-dependent oxidoreductase
MGQTVTALGRDGDGVDVTFSDGSGSRFDLVVGADGIRSAVRRFVAPEIAPRYAGYTSWRFVVEGEAAADHPVELWGTGRRVGVVPIGGGQTYAYATANTPEGGRDPEPAAESFRRRFADFGGPVPEVLAGLGDGAALIRTDISEAFAPRWVFGRVVLLGDAAHAMTPNLGQGAAMAIEDAFVLANALASAHPPAKALAEYERVRLPRVRAIADEARRLGKIGQWESPLACGLRSRVMKLVPASASSARMERLLVDGAPALGARA